ncbi:MAG: hypothetical protein ACHQIK_10955 [Candidatus Acidiferrales bacterium]
MSFYTGGWNKSTRIFVFNLENGTTIAHTKVHRVRCKKHQSGRSGHQKRDVLKRTRDKAMVTVKSSQKIFTDAEIASLTGICVDHIRNFAKSRHLGFIARAAEAAGKQADQWLFTLSDLMVLVTLFPRCTH